MRKEIVACIVLSVGVCLGQRTEFFDHKTASTGVPFRWPSTWADVSETSVRQEDVLRLLVELTRDDIVPISAIQGFRFVPLEKDQFYLVAVVDFTGRDFFNGVEVVRCVGVDCVSGPQPTEEPDLNADLVDVKGDGVFEMITKELASPYVGMVNTVPLFAYSIRALIGGDLIDVSSRYPDYFRDHILPRMARDRKAVEANIANMDRSQPLHVSDLDGSKRLTPTEEESNRRGALMMQAWKVKATAEIQYVQDDYHRRVLGEKTAGLVNALKWARSDDKGLQEFAVQALEPIDSPTAAAELLRIANSGDPSTAEDARNALSRRAEARLAPPPANGTEKK